MNTTAADPRIAKPALSYQSITVNSNTKQYETEQHVEAPPGFSCLFSMQRYQHVIVNEGFRGYLFSIFSHFTSQLDLRTIEPNHSGMISYLLAQHHPQTSLPPSGVNQSAVETQLISWGFSTIASRCILGCLLQLGLIIKMSETDQNDERFHHRSE